MKLLTFKKLINKCLAIMFSPALAAVILLSSCNDSTTSKEEKTAVTATGSYTANQQLFCLNMLSNVSAEYNGQKGIQATTVSAVKSVLGDQGIQNLIGTWNLVWGPRVYVSAKDTVLNTMFIAQQAGTSNYVVAIAGTDPKSSLDWIFEDFDAIAKVPWPYGNVDTGKVHITLPTFTGLTVLQTMLDTINGKSLGAREFLQSQLSNNNTINVWVTGHSLGGALSPTYALFLNDTKSTWATNGTANINVLAVAGASPGDTGFSNYYTSQLGNNTYRVWNAMDVVPHGFEPDMLDKIITLYANDTSVDPFPKYIKIKGVPILSKLAMGTIELMCTAMGYYQLYPPKTINFTSNVYMPPHTSYPDQALYQHVPAYPVFFGVSAFQSGMQTVLKLPAPFFSGGITNTVSISNYDTTGMNFNYKPL